MKKEEIELNSFEKLYLELFDYSPNISKDDVINSVRGYFEKVCPILNVGEIVLEINTPDSACSLENSYFKNSVFVKNPGNGKPFVFMQSFSESTFIKAVVIPSAGHEFTDNEVDRLSLINKHIFDYFGRFRGIELLRNAPFQEQLTKGPNSLGSIKYVNEHIKNHTISEYASIFSNIKNFKTLNQLYGELNGENLIVEYYNRLASVIGDNGIAARLGGDNFFILIKKEYLDDVLSVLKEIVVNLNDEEIKVESWAGYYYVKPEDGYYDIIGRANIACKYAKNKYRISQYGFTDNDIEIINNNIRIKHEVIEAMKVRNLVTFYQPKVELDNYTLCGSEALVRWNKNGEIVGPGAFIPILEAENMILELDYYILDAVCRDIRKWLDMNFEPVRVSINFSMAHITEENSIEKVMEIINKYDIDPKYIEIELTEMTDVSNLELFTKYIIDLKSHGILVSMDDFGTGFASLDILRRGNYDVVKIDKSIINDIDKVPEDDYNYIIIKDIVKLLNDLKKCIICEGVERKTQLDILKKMGCREIQGYYFDKPLPISEYEKRLINKKY